MVFQEEDRLLWVMLDHQAMTTSMVRYQEQTMAMVEKFNIFEPWLTADN